MNVKPTTVRMLTSGGTEVRWQGVQPRLILVPSENWRKGGKRFSEISREPSIRVPPASRLPLGTSFSANISSRLRRRRPSCFRTRAYRKRPDVPRQSAVAEKSRDYKAWINREETGCRSFVSKLWALKD